MDTLIDSVFTGDAPSLVLRAAPGASAATGSRSGILPAEAVKRAVAEWADRLPAKPAPMRLRVLEGLALLWHDHWDASHEIAQAHEGDPDHDLLHAILHRREGDFPNAGYWLGGSVKHPCYRMLALRFASLPEEGLNAVGLQDDRWSSRVLFAAIRDNEDKALRRRVSAGGARPSGETLIRVQAEEFRAFAGYLIGSED